MDTITRAAHEYADGVAVLYGGDHADPETVAGELREQARSIDACAIALDRDPTDDEREQWYDLLHQLADERERIELHPECVRFGYVQDGRCCGH